MDDVDDALSTMQEMSSNHRLRTLHHLKNTNTRKGSLFHSPNNNSLHRLVSSCTEVHISNDAKYII